MFSYTPPSISESFCVPEAMTLYTPLMLSKLSITDLSIIKESPLKYNVFTVSAILSISPAVIEYRSPLISNCSPPP